MPWRESSTVTTATAFPRANGSVWASPGVVAELLAGADGEARSELTGRRHALARSGACLCASGHVWARHGHVAFRPLARSPRSTKMSSVFREVRGRWMTWWCTVELTRERSGMVR